MPGGIQGLDRYAYTANNPVRYIDPTGHVNQATCNYMKNYMCETDDPPPPTPLCQAIYCSPTAFWQYIWSQALVTLVFSGTGNNGAPITVSAQMPAWSGLGTNVDFPGYANGGTEQQAYDAHGIASNVPVNLICYSAGAESCLLYAQWRIDNGQPVNAVVLIGPTFGGENNDSFDDWSGYLDSIIKGGADILVIDDRAHWGEQARDYRAPVTSTGGIFFYDYWDLNHVTRTDALGDQKASNLNTDLVAWVLDWITNPHQIPHDRWWYECTQQDMYPCP